MEGTYHTDVRKKGRGRGGRSLTELFQSGETGFSIFRKFLRGIGEAHRSLRFESPIIVSYYQQLMLRPTKRKFQLMLKYFICIYAILLLELGMIDPDFNMTRLTRLNAYCIFVLLIYSLNHWSWKHETYVRVALILCVSTTTIIFWTRSRVIRQANGLHSVGIILILGMFVLLLPLRTILCSSFAFLYVLIMCLLGVLHNAHPSKLGMNQSMTESLYLDAFRALRLDNLTHWNNDMHTIIYVDLYLWFPIILIGIYLRCWIVIRSYFTFFKLGENVQAKLESRAAMEREIRWIEAIMPSGVRVEYQALRQKHEDTSASLWVYNKVYDNVSILFADIVGFTKMSSNKSARTVVRMLNNLFNRFDALCEATKCEKLGTLGDCYYCIAGCPVPRSNHANCCVEMGLGMCRIIKLFNQDFDASVNMRIGVHTGRVNAAIIGSQRIRFDVYSYDVIIASAMESSGRPGRVHISAATFELVKTMYNCSRGEPVEVRKEQVYGIAGMELVMTQIDTYFVDPRSSLWRVKHERYGQAENQPGHSQATELVRRKRFSTLNDPGKQQTDSYSKMGRSSESSSLGTRVHEEWTYTKNEIDFMENFRSDMQIICAMEVDPERHNQLYRQIALRPISLRFLDYESEWQYYTQIHDHTRKTHVDSQKVAPISDVLACLTLHFLILFSCLALLVAPRTLNKSHLGIAFGTSVFCCFIGFLLTLGATNYEHTLKSSIIRTVYRRVTHPIGHELCLAWLTICPSILFYLFCTMRKDPNLIIRERYEFSMVAFHCLLIHTLPLSSAAWARTISALITFYILVHSCTSLRPEPAVSHYCQSLVPLIDGVPVQHFRWIFMLQLVLLTVAVIRVCRENERNCRHCFHVTREAEITEEEAERSMQSARVMLHNIIPKYVLDQLNIAGSSHRSFNYAVSIPNAGVAFATISNFFSKYYREDYKGGEGALKLLNNIVCAFDSLVNRPEMKDVEKIKTINDCYMFASGLNTEETRRNASNLTHLISLMDCCHKMIGIMNEINDMYIIGTDYFEIKIGYNFGPLIAGVIGTTKPMYDIWGDTVNVASRMYSTGVIGKIQVPNYVADALGEHFDFVYRGEVFVKGKGDMSTYLCERKSIAR